MTTADFAGLVFDNDTMRLVLGTAAVIGVVLLVVGALLHRAEPSIGRPIIQAGGTLACAALAFTGLGAALS